MWKPKNQPEEDSRFESVKCPVCRVVFGRRDKETIYLAHCEECKATFYWKPWAKAPSVTMDKDAVKKHRYCDRNGCYCR